MKTKSTIKDVAKEAGVSQAAVSVVLSPTQRVSSIRVGNSTRTRIFDAATRLGYRPCHLASGLAGGKTYTVGLLWPLGHPASNASAAEDLVVRLHKCGYLTYLIGHSSFSKTATMEVLDQYIQQRVDIAVVMIDGPKHHSKELNQRLNLLKSGLVVSNTIVDVPCDIIVHDRCSAVRKAVMHFAKSNRSKLGYMMPVRYDLLAKYDHFKAEAESHNCQHTLIDVTGKEATRPEDFWNALDYRLKKGETCDALLCSTDEGAMAAINCLVANGLRVPQDVAVVGFNNSIGFEYALPPLASVERNERSLIDEVENMVFTRLENEELPLRTSTIEMNFIWRQSAG